jgi:hypothetical protein
VVYFVTILVYFLVCCTKKNLATSLFTHTFSLKLPSLVLHSLLNGS